MHTENITFLTNKSLMFLEEVCFFGVQNGQCRNLMSSASSSFLYVLSSATKRAKESSLAAMLSKIVQEEATGLWMKGESFKRKYSKE